MQRRWHSRALRLASIAAVGAWATAAPAFAAEVSLGYSGLTGTSEGMVHGVQLSVASGRPGLGFTADAAYYHPSDGAILAAAGPRWYSRTSAGGTRVFIQLVGGLVAADGGGGFFAAPGAGVDFAADKKLGGRLQVDGPFFVGGGIADVVRVSGGIVWRPGQHRPAAAH